MGKSGQVSLVVYEAKFREQLMAFRIPPEQAVFTGMPAETLDDALSDPDKLAVVIAEGERAAGFFILHTGEQIAGFYKDYRGAVLLRAFLVDHDSQGRGVAKAALALLSAFVRLQLPEINEIVLAVNERNVAAVALYLRGGFRDNGLRRISGKGTQKILQYVLGGTADAGKQNGDVEKLNSDVKKLNSDVEKLNSDVEKLNDDAGKQNGDVEKQLCERLTGIFSRSPLLMDVFHKARYLEPLPYYIGAGCLVQTVWNELTGRPADYGIGDIDLIYYDPEDLSFAAEDRMIAEGRERFDGVYFPLDVKNQARVHLWYPDKFGVSLPPYPSLEAAIDSWPTTVTSLGARLDAEGAWQIYAPFGLEDLFDLILRPNKALISEEVYLAKVHKWHSKWPELRIIPWNG